MSEDSSVSLYERIGGEPAVRELVERFYQNMFVLDGVEHVRAVHQGDLTEVKQRLFMYFTGWFGGPPLFIDAYGHPKLRMRHKHVVIGLAERDEWLKCLHVALDSMNLDSELNRDLREKIDPMADHMRNKPEDGHPFSSC